MATVCRVPRLFTGAVDRAAGWSIARIREVTIETDAPMMFHVDGEPVGGDDADGARSIRRRCGSRSEIGDSVTWRFGDCVNES